MTKSRQKINVSVTFFLFCVALFINETLFGFYLPTHSPVPGGVALIPLKSDHRLKPKVSFQDKAVFVLENPNKDEYSKFPWLAVVGISLLEKPGTKKIIVKTEKETSTVSFQVTSKQYKEERLTIPSQRKVTPLPEDFKKIEQDKAQFLKTYQTWTANPPKTLLLSMPVSGRASSSFGLRRIMNGIPKNPHNGMDIAAPEGMPVRSPLAGTVLQAGDYFYSGNAVVLDHGQGFMTTYAHLNEIYVRSNQSVQVGDVLGVVGSTGRVTGPHLHWMVTLNQSHVDPALFIKNLENLGEDTGNL